MHWDLHVCQHSLIHSPFGRHVQIISCAQSICCLLSTGRAAEHTGTSGFCDAGVFLGMDVDAVLR